MSDKREMLNKGLLGIGLALMVASLYMVFVYVPTAVNEAGEEIIQQRIFYFHVPAAWVSFLAFFITFICSILYLLKRASKWDTIALASAEVGVIFNTLVLITGPIWAKSTWGEWWWWEARLTTSLVLWLTYVAYLLVRGYAEEPERGARFAAVVGIVGFINVPIVFLATRLWTEAHPTNLVFEEGGLASSMLATLLVCIAAFTVLYVLLTMQSARLKAMESEIRYLRDEKEQDWEGDNL